MSQPTEAGAISATTVVVSKAAQPAASCAATAAEADKPVKAYRLKMQGFTVELIAKNMGVCQRTVYRWLKEHSEEYVAQLQAQPAINVLAEHIAALEEMERLALQDYRRATGNRDRHSFLKAAGSFRQQIIDLQVKVGVMPSSASRLHVSVQDSCPLAGAGDDVPKPTKEELMARLIELVGNRKQLPPLDYSDEDRAYEARQHGSEGAFVNQPES